MNEIDLADTAKTATIPTEYGVGVIPSEAGTPVVVAHAVGVNAATGDPEQVSLAMTMEGAAEFVRAIVDAVQAAQKQGRSFRGPKR